MAQQLQPFNPPIFVHGIVKRSGTNYLRDLLCMHPDCYFGGPVWEHELLEHAELLGLYSRFTYHRWPKRWQVEKKLGPPTRLMASLGQGLINFLNGQLLGPNLQYDPAHLPLSPTLRLVSKSPSVENLPYFFQLFPNAKLLLIIRDGRAVIESMERSFKKGFEPALHEWHTGAKIILNTLPHIPSNRYRLIKYEELYTNTEAELTEIMQFVGLDVSRYNFETIQAMPVRGSSELTKAGKLHWQAVEKKGFNPLARWHTWDEAKHQRFNWVAGQAQQTLGYDCEPIKQTPASITQNMLKDMVWQPLWPIQRTLRKLKYMLGL